MNCLHFNFAAERAFLKIVFRIDVLPAGDIVIQSVRLAVALRAWTAAAANILFTQLKHLVRLCVTSNLRSAVQPSDS